MKICFQNKLGYYNQIYHKYVDFERTTNNTIKDRTCEGQRRRCVSVVVLLSIIALLLVVEGLIWLAMYGARNPLVDGQIEYPEVISCYYSTPNETQQTQQLMPADIHPALCTHINVAFARVVNKEIFLEESQYAALKDVVNLKRTNPNLKVLLSIGGARDDNGFPDMVKDHASRKTFIRSIKHILRNHSLDGVDLDWEFPALHTADGALAASARDRQHFSQLLREIRAEYRREKRDYLLTVALAAPQIIADVSYDVDQINMYVDYANLMTYDFHYYSTSTPFTGLNSPLYARADEALYLATLNVNYTVNMYIAKGLDKSKIVVGIPTYGHTFTLMNADNGRVGAPAGGPGELGGRGYVDYPAVCAFRRSPSRRVTERFDESARVPYLYSGTEWVSYDSPASVADKADYIKARGLRGAMIYSLNSDDYGGRCTDSGGGAEPEGDGRFPLASSVRRALRRHS